MDRQKIFDFAVAAEERALRDCRRAAKLAEKVAACRDHLTKAGLLGVAVDLAVYVYEHGSLDQRAGRRCSVVVSSHAEMSRNVGCSKSMIAKASQTLYKHGIFAATSFTNKKTEFALSWDDTNALPYPPQVDGQLPLFCRKRPPRPPAHCDCDSSNYLDSANRDCATVPPGGRLQRDRLPVLEAERPWATVTDAEVRTSRLDVAWVLYDQLPELPRVPVWYYAPQDVFRNPACMSFPDDCPLPEWVESHDEGRRRVLFLGLFRHAARMPLKYPPARTLQTQTSKGWFRYVKPDTWRWSAEMICDPVWSLEHSIDVYERIGWNEIVANTAQRLPKP